MKTKPKPSGYWTEERLQEEALKYNNWNKFPYKAAVRIDKKKPGFIESICGHILKIRTPLEYWTKELCEIESKKYKGRAEFKDKSFGAYRASFINGWLDDFYPKLNKEKCHQEALKYNIFSEFKLNSASVFDFAYRNKFLDEICSHMEKGKRPNGYWTKENCHKEALKHNNKNDFRLHGGGAYATAHVNGWIDEICSHMDIIFVGNGYWSDNKERCQEEALKYTKKTDFLENSGGCYKAAYKKGWLDEICSHMIKCGSKSSQMIYAVEFEDNSVYIGLTNNKDRRYNDHIIDKRSTVYKHIEKTSLIPMFKEMSEYIPTMDAIKLEGDTIELYRNMGWNVLNIAKHGSIGKYDLRIK